MKFLNIMAKAFVSTVFLINTAYADALPTHSLTIPFQHELILSDTHMGISFTYDMTSIPTQKVVCKLEEGYKTWLEGPIDVSPTFGGNEIIVLSSTQQSREVSSYMDVVHVTSPVGEIKIFDTHSGQWPQLSMASCHYEKESNART